MNIQEAVKEGIKQKKMIKRKSWETPDRLIPTNDPFNLIACYVSSEKRIFRGWQPMTNDLIADDWYITNESYKNITLLTKSTKT